MMNLNDKIVCPLCGNKNTWQPENSYRPFCSERCRLIDLGEWASENYRVALDPEPMSDHDIDKNQDS